MLISDRRYNYGKEAMMRDALIVGDLGRPTRGSYGNIKEK